MGLDMHLVRQRAKGGLRAAEVTALEPAALASADALFCCNSLRGIVAIGRHEEQQWRAHPVIERLQAAYREALCASVG